MSRGREPSLSSVWQGTHGTVGRIEKVQDCGPGCSLAGEEQRVMYVLPPDMVKHVEYSQNMKSGPDGVCYTDSQGRTKNLLLKSVLFTALTPGTFPSPKGP